MKSKQSIRSRGRYSSGGALVESVASLVVLAMLLVGGLGVVCGVGVYMLYKIKMGFITNQAAQYAAGLLSWNTNVNPQQTGSTFPTPGQKVATAVDGMCAAAGLPTPAVTTVTDNGATVTCTVQVAGGVTPLGFPVPIAILDSASADLTTYQPPALLYLHPQAAPGYTLAIPSYGYQSKTNFLNTPQYKYNITFPGPVSYN